MSTFDQTQNELSQFLEDQFAPPTEQQNEATPAENDDIDVNEFLQGDEDTTVEFEQQAQPEHKPVPQPDDRILQLERELAATKARTQMYETALSQQFQPPQQPQEQQPAVPPVAFLDDEIAVDQRYMEDYGDADPYIQSVAKRVANDLYQRAVLPLQQELYNVRGQLQSQAEFNASQQKNTLHMQLKSVVPEIDEIVTTPEWQSYIKQPDLYGSGRTIASYVQEGIQYGNIRQLAQIVNQFKQTRQKAQPGRAQVAPGRAQAEMPNTTPKRGTVLKMSEFDRATSEFQAGRLSWDKYQVVMSKFNDAMLEGRVNYNK